MEEREKGKERRKEGGEGQKMRQRRKAIVYYEQVFVVTIPCCHTSGQSSNTAVETVSRISVNMYFAALHSVQFKLDLSLRRNMLSTILTSL